MVMRKKRREKGAREKGALTRQKVCSLLKNNNRISICLFFAGTVEHDVNSQQTSPGSVPVGQQVELDSDQTQEESPTTIGAFSGFFTGIATAVEQKVSQTSFS